MGCIILERKRRQADWQLHRAAVWWVTQWAAEGVPPILGWSCCQRWVKSGGVAASPDLRECHSKNVNHFVTAALRSSEDWWKEETTPLWSLIFSWITQPSELWYLFLFLNYAQKKKWEERMNKVSFSRAKYYSFRASITCHFCSCGILCILLYSLCRIE